MEKTSGLTSHSPKGLSDRLKTIASSASSASRAETIHFLSISSCNVSCTDLQGNSTEHYWLRHLSEKCEIPWLGRNHADKKVRAELHVFQFRLWCSIWLSPLGRPPYIDGVHLLTFSFIRFKVVHRWCSCLLYYPKSDWDTKYILMTENMWRWEDWGQFELLCWTLFYWFNWKTCN